MRYSITALGLILLHAVMLTQANAEGLPPGATLSAEHSDRAYALRSQQQQYLHRELARGAPRAGRLNLYGLMLNQRAKQRYMHDQQRLEQHTLSRRLKLNPGLPPGPAAQLQLQRFRRQEATQQFHFRVQRDLRR
jgi:hypothetical protein